MLPAGLTPDEKAERRSFFWFLDCQVTGSNDERTDPARYQHREAPAFGVLIVLLVVARSLRIMANLNSDMMPMGQMTNLQMER